MFGGRNTYVSIEPFALLTQLEMYCAKRQINAVVSTNTAILSKLLSNLGNNKDSPSLNDYAGSVFTYKSIEIVFVSPLAQLFTVPYGKFICERFISKVVSTTAWAEPSTFSFSTKDILDAASFPEAYQQFSTAYAIAVDIETLKSPLAIRCIGYTAVFISAVNAITTRSVVFPVNSEYNLAWMRKFNDLPAQKIFQNGKYDNAYLLRYNAPVRNWLWDTAHYFHSWYSELPKDLAFLNAFFLRKVVYWKDLAETSDVFEYYKYNALDTWATANVWIQQLLSSPDWVKRNYTLEFPLVFPCLLAEMTGLIRDQEKLIEKRKEVEASIEAQLSSLRRMLGSKTFNPNSPVQVKTLLKILGCGDITSTKEIFLKKAMFRHPLNNKILGQIIKIRGLRKLATTYLRTDEDAKQSGIHEGEGGAKEFQGFWLYSQNPHGTDTARLASGEHAFWCGANIQNVPVRAGPIIRETIVSAPGFYFGESDLRQAETWDTAHICGDARMIAAVSGVRDFHSVNASVMSGQSYESIYDDSTKKTKNKKLRDLFKRVNHGANYNMGPDVLVDTMGLEMIFEAAKLLGVRENDPRKIAAFLLDKFHATYVKLRGITAPFTAGTYYAWVVEQIAITKKLTSRAFHHTSYNLQNYKPEQYIKSGDWTRYCFGKPDKSKLDLNAYVAHCPQSLNARTLNEGFMKVFYEMALPNPATFRLHAQIHDSIFFSYAEQMESHATRVKELMEIPVSVQDVSGVTRTFTVPADLKIGRDGKPAKYWSETE
jgi:DNA polymerase I-like protein with 3'-5' exonuclease and polymerase domains